MQELSWGRSDTWVGWEEGRGGVAQKKKSPEVCITGPFLESPKNFSGPISHF